MVFIPCPILPHKHDRYRDNVCLSNWLRPVLKVVGYAMSYIPSSIPEMDDSEETAKRQYLVGNPLVVGERMMMMMMMITHDCRLFD